MNYIEKQASIEAYLKTGKVLTVLDAVKLFSTIDLRKYVSLLKQKGLDIQSEWVFTSTAKFKKYWMEVEVCE